MDEQTSGQVVDVRNIPKAERHPKIMAVYNALPASDYLSLLNDHEPVNLRKEFERNLPGTYTWQATERIGGDWEIIITKLTNTPAPRIMTNTAWLGEQENTLDGAIWKLEPDARDLDANIIALQPHQEIGEHRGPDLDVLIHVFEGTGTLHTEIDSISLNLGDVLYLPARSRRHFVAGDHGLKYFSVHQRKKTLGLMPTLRTTND
ncbi:DUF2249 domain-containing protein [Arthrobacter sp. MYb213]|uniref:DUF2249 domain-containing protein n=1 Tax=Arthrobacter sp. MYb213 TaxID=1848595 RepID=UPI000CFDE4E7|nr:DUF2249 domain-containing protein [Arthrobacter sp. MYb213]PRB72348.1 hypothetical protein CQ011_01405 [Arthrobacter sp. MYb213]